jgi:citrate lyase subunit beta / citryl-CoA lyase
MPMDGLRRSVLYMPASNARALEKARTLAADAFIFDLEDAVAPEAKVAARAQAITALKAGGYGNKTLLIRVNGLGTAWFADDIAAAATSGAHGVLVPKIEQAGDLTRVNAALASAQAPGGFRIWSMIETPRAILNLGGIASQGGRLEALVAGFADLAKDLGTRDRQDRAPLLYALSGIVLAARAHGLIALDGVYPPFTDPDGCRTEAEQARDFGYDGKTLIHPSQIEIANSVFSPSAEEIAKAKEIVAVFDAAVSTGKGVAVLNGKMVEVLHAIQARALLQSAAVMGLV